GYARSRVVVALRVPPGDALRPAGAEVEVRDDGPGIQPEEREAVFEPFHRGARSGERRGTGLGLAICRSVVEAPGGRIWIEDAPEGGALFRFWIPSKAPAETPAT